MDYTRLPDSLSLALQSPQQAREGARIPMTIRLTNTGVRPAEVALGGRPIAFDIIVRTSDGREVWRRSHGVVHNAILQLRVLRPSESVSFSHDWDQRDRDGRPVSPGLYQVRGFLATDAPKPFATEPVPLLIVPA